MMNITQQPSRPQMVDSSGTINENKNESVSSVFGRRVASQPQRAHVNMRGIRRAIFQTIIEGPKRHRNIALPDFECTISLKSDGPPMTFSRRERELVEINIDSLDLLFKMLHVNLPKEELEKTQEAIRALTLSEPEECKTARPIPTGHRSRSWCENCTIL